jgi:hypothetical protein
MRASPSRWIVAAVALLSFACARHRGGAPADEAEEFVRQLTPEEWEQMMGRRHPPCEVAAQLTTDSWRRWPLGSANVALRLPPGFRADDRPREGALASWSRSDSSYVEVLGNEALMGLAAAGEGLEHETDCAIRVLGRQAPVIRIRFVRAERPETTYFAVMTTVVRRGEGLAVGMATRTAAGRDSLLHAIATMDSTPP